MKICKIEGCGLECSKGPDREYRDAVCDDHNRLITRVRARERRREDPMYGRSAVEKARYAARHAAHTQVVPEKIVKEDPRLSADYQSERERVKAASWDEYNTGPAKLYLLDTDPRHYPYTRNGGVTKQPMNGRRAGYRRNLDWNNPHSRTLEFKLMAWVPDRGYEAEAALHAELDKLGDRHGTREEWTIFNYDAAAAAFKRVVAQFGGEIIS